MTRFELFNNIDTEQFKNIHWPFYFFFRKLSI